MRHHEAGSWLATGVALAATLALGCGVARAQAAPRTAGEQQDVTAPSEETREQRLTPPGATSPKEGAQAEAQSPSEIAVAAAEQAAMKAGETAAGWSVYIAGMPRPDAPRGPSFGAGLGGSDTFELGPVPGNDLGAWSPRFGVGPRAFDSITGAR